MPSRDPAKRKASNRDAQKRRRQRQRDERERAAGDPAATGCRRCGELQATVTALRPSLGYPALVHAAEPGKPGQVTSLWVEDRGALIRLQMTHRYHRWERTLEAAKADGEALSRAAVAAAAGRAGPSSTAPGDRSDRARTGLTSAPAHAEPPPPSELRPEPALPPPNHDAISIPIPRPGEPARPPRRGRELPPARGCPHYVVVDNLCQRCYVDVRTVPPRQRPDGPR